MVSVEVYYLAENGGRKSRETMISFSSTYLAGMSMECLPRKTKQLSVIILQHDVGLQYRCTVELDHTARHEKVESTRIYLNNTAVISRKCIGISE